jgi:hypothetical protein
MILKTFLTEKLPIACKTTLGFIFSTWLRISTEGASFVAFVPEVIARVTYVLLCHGSLNVSNYAIVLCFRIIQQIQFFTRNRISGKYNLIRA